MNDIWYYIMYHTIAACMSYYVISYCFRVLHVGPLSGPNRGQNLVSLPTTKELMLDKDGLQQHLGDRMSPAKLLLKGT